MLSDELAAAEDDAKDDYVTQECGAKWGLAATAKAKWKRFAICIMTHFMTSKIAWPGGYVFTNKTIWYDAINTLPFGKKYKNSRLNLALYWLMKQHEDVLPDTFFEKTPDYCAKFKLPILGVMQKILDEQAAAAIKITAWLRKYLARRATTAIVANS